MQILYFSLALINDFFGTNESSSFKDNQSLKKLRDYVFGTFAFPLALNVAILFWSLYAFDRQTVFPQEVDAFFPAWLNHVIHTNIAVFAIIEMIILHHQYPARTEGLLGLMTFMHCYLIWMFVTKYFAGRFAYPILDVLSITGKIGFISFTMSFPALMFLLGEYLNGKIWNENRLKRM